MSCEHCTDPDGEPCFPMYGLAPHRHGKTAIEFDTSPVSGFTPDRESPTHGIWWCVHCGHGRPAHDLDKGQTRKHSLVESLVNVAIGYGVSILAQLLVFPLYGIHVSLLVNAEISFWFTLVSIARSYILRRVMRDALREDV